MTAAGMAFAPNVPPLGYNLDLTSFQGRDNLFSSYHVALDRDTPAPTTTEHHTANTSQSAARQSKRVAASRNKTTKSRAKEAPTSTDRSSQEADGQTKRPRGRPRLKQDDATAAERRRTQIRKAQRAYRQRKDTVLVDMEKKMSKLRQENKDLSSEFTDFVRCASEQGVLESAPQLALRLKSLSEKVARLAQDEEQDEDGLTGDEVGQLPQAEENREDSHDALVDDHVPWEDVTQLPGTTPPNTQLSSLARMSVPDSLPVIPSYAYQEATFARRLHRFTLEGGLWLASIPRPPPDLYEAVFGFCLIFETRDTIRQRMLEGLRTADDENFNVWTVPFTNLGGSGWFYPTGDSGGESSEGSPGGNQRYREVRKNQLNSGFSMGPFDAEIEKAREKIDRRMRLMHAGFEGDFFDPDEVDMYLRQRGILIPPQSSIVEAEVDMSDFDNDYEQGFGIAEDVMEWPTGDLGSAPGVSAPVGTATGENWSSNGSGTSNFGNPMSSLLDENTVMQGVPNGLTPDLALFDDGTEAFQDFTTNQQWLTPARPKTKIRIDVNALAKELLYNSVCLGRAAGMRPKDINKAVKVAIGQVPPTLRGIRKLP